MTALLSIAAPVAIMIACGVLGGFFEALADARKILANKKVDHVVSGVVRVGIALLIGALCAGLGKHFDGLRPTAMGPLFAIMGLSAFNPVFRWTMNKKRGLDWRYVSTSNFYDRFFIACSVYRTPFPFFPVHPPRVHWNLYNGPPTRYTRGVHRAGLIMYILELSCLITSALLYGTGVILSNTN